MDLVVVAPSHYWPHKRSAAHDGDFKTCNYYISNQMKAATERKVIRWIHILLSIPIVGYIYGPVAQIEGAALMVKVVFFPIMVLSGFWLWLGHWVRKRAKSK